MIMFVFPAVGMTLIGLTLWGFPKLDRWRTRFLARHSHRP